MARKYSIDEKKAQIAGLLHDWDKCLNDEELLERAIKFDIELVEGIEDMAALLHALTGAVAFRLQSDD